MKKTIMLKYVLKLTSEFSNFRPIGECVSRGQHHWATTGRKPSCVWRIGRQEPLRILSQYVHITSLLNVFVNIKTLVHVLVLSFLINNVFFRLPLSSVFFK